MRASRKLVSEGDWSREERLSMAEKKTTGCDKNDNQVGQIAEQMADKVKESANQIWLAGLGAYSKAEEEGSKLFDTLVQDGEKLEAKTRAIVDKPITAAKEKVETVRARATGSWEKVERAFDHRVSKALHRLNIPTRGDMDVLYQRVDRLTQEVEAATDAARKRKNKQSVA